MTKNKMAARLKRLLAMTSRTVSLRQSVLPWQRKCWLPAYARQRPAGATLLEVNWSPGGNEPISRRPYRSRSVPRARDWNPCPSSKRRPHPHRPL